MSDACIVCLEDLELQVQVPIPQTIPHDDLKVTMLDEHQPHNHPGKLDNQQFVAQIKPCDHVLHDDCLRMWSQEANSCPICRATFNLVLVLDKVGGKLLVLFVLPGMVHNVGIWTWRLSLGIVKELICSCDDEVLFLAKVWEFYTQRATLNLY